MGVVYRAHDERLDRDVAIKVLPESVAQDEERLARFEREARLLASLSHQNIATLYGLEQHEGQLFLVMELVEGESLADIQARGAILVDEALSIALQIAEGLEAAHKQGIIHRDLKPANVMLSSEGKVKVLDFGLAKAWRPDENNADLTHSPTLTAQMTAAGVLLGTAAYMSPEQARGKRVDKRADIWAFGVVLYEMLTGRRLFTGETVSDVLASVIKDEPNWTRLPHSTPVAVRLLLERCLLRDVRNRLRDIGEARFTLNQPLPDPPPTVNRRSRWLVSSAVLALILAVAGISLRAFRGTAASPQKTATVHPITANPIEFAVTGTAISPDGQYVAIADARGLSMRLLATGETHQVDLGPEFESVDAWWFPNQPRLLLLGGTSDGSHGLWIAQPFGGRPRKIRDEVFTAAISPRGDRIAFIGSASETGRARRDIWLMDADGANASKFLEASPDESFWRLAWSPDAKRLAYGVWAANSYAIETRRVEDREGRTDLLSDSRIFQNWTGILPIVWASDGRLIFGRREEGLNQQISNIWAVETDVARGEALGTPTRLTRLAAFNVRGLSISADGKLMSALLVQNQADIYLGHLNKAGTAFTQVTQVTSDGRDDFATGWMPDGQSLLFDSKRTGKNSIFKWALSSRSVTLIFEGSGGGERVSVSTSDGSWVLVLTGQGVVRIPAEGGPAEVLSERGDAVQCSPALHSNCILGHVDGTEYVFSLLNPETRALQELHRISYRAPFTNWALAPNGSRVAVVHNDDNVVRVVDLSTGKETPLTVSGWKYFEFVAWAADGERLFLNAGSSGAAGELKSLIGLGMDGEVAVLKSDANEWPVMPKPSPDGRYLAYSGMAFHGNAWLISDF